MTDPDVPSSGRFEGRRHLLPVRIYYEDTDHSGIVYHANYLRYFERGRSDFLRRAGIVHSELLKLDPPTAFAIIGMDVRFKKAARIDDALLVETTYDAIVGVRLKISQSITRGADLVATAAVEAVSIDLQGRPRRPSAQLHAAIGHLLLPTTDG